MRGGLHVEADVGELRSERAGDDERVLVGVGDELLRQPVLVVRALDREGGHAWGEPGQDVLAVGGVVHRRGARRRCEEAQLVHDDAVEGRVEDLAQVAVGERVPDLALGSRCRAERHLATGAPHWRRSGAAWCLHRALSMERGRGG